MTPAARGWPGPLGSLAPALLLASGAAWAAPGTAAAPGPASAEAPAGPAVARTRVAGSPRQFPNPTLLTQDGTSVRFYDDLVRGRVVMLNFAYTRCNGRCPRTNAQLAAALRLLGARAGREVTLLTLSLDPEHDTPEAMRGELARHGAPPAWTWLTGRKEDLEGIRRFLGLVDPDPAVDADRTRHTGVVVLGNDRSGRWTTVPGLVRPELIAEAVLRLAGGG